MKNIVIGLLVLNSALTSASVVGTPSEDPAVKAIQNAFAKAKAPVEADLNLDTPWNCKEFIAAKGDFRTFDRNNGFNFSIDDYGLLVNTGTAKAKYFTYESDGLVGTYPSDEDGAVGVVRVNEKGNLIIEHSMPKSSVYRYSEQTQRTVIARAIYDSSHVVMTYAICAKAE